MLDKRVAVGWLVGSAALWVLLEFVFDVRYAWAWVGVVLLAVGINGYIATHLKDDGGA